MVAGRKGPCVTILPAYKAEPQSIQEDIGMTKPKVSARSRRAVRSALILALVGTAIGLSIRLGSTEEVVIRQVRATAPFQSASPASPVDALAEFEFADAQLPEPFALRKGQTLGQLLRGLGMSGQEVHRAVTALASEINLRKVRAGQSGLAYYDSEGSLNSLRLELYRRGWLTLDKRQGHWSASMKEFVRSSRRRNIEGSLESFLFNDVERAGGMPAVAIAMSDVLQWDLDFNRDLRKGDRFGVLYEESLLDNRFDGIGRILALTYENRGVQHEAYLFGDAGAEGYYDAEGRPLQKMFLKSPLPFMRVTSRFTHSRFHPVLKRNRPHYGVDLGAPRGTPVRVTATGSVTFVGRQGGAGKMVKVRHPNGYETMYLHLSGFAKGMSRGAKVRQGDVIGFVGSTGLSTGPHLDYRVKKNKRYLNPLQLENRPAEPIDDRRMADFIEQRDRFRSAMLNSSSSPEMPPRRASEPRRPARTAR